MIIYIIILKERFLLNINFFKSKADWSVCSGNWNWISCGDPEEVLNEDITFCPVKYGKKIDPNGEYIK